jgi:hypothetical protein
MCDIDPSRPEVDDKQIDADSERYLKICDVIGTEWYRRFPVLSEEEKLSVTREQMVNRCVAMFKFCDEQTPVVPNLKRISQEDAWKVFAISNMRSSLFKDISKTQYFDEIMFKAFPETMLNSEVCVV